MAASQRPPRALVDDDEILAWWEAHANGVSIQTIAFRYGRAPQVIRRHFDELGIQPYWNDLNERERRIAEALHRCMTIDDGSLYRRQLPYARSLQHIKPMRRKRIPQSERERRMDRLAAPYRSLVRQDLRRAGLIP